MHAHRAVQSETDTHLSWAGLFHHCFLPLVAPVFITQLIRSFLHIVGFVHGQAAGSGGLPGVLRLHIGEEHPQCFPNCGHGLHGQTPACEQTQPCAPPLQETPASPQQDGAAVLHVQQGQVQELLHHVNTAQLMLGKKQSMDKQCRCSSNVDSYNASLFFASQKRSHSLTWTFDQEHRVQREQKCLMLIFKYTCTKRTDTIRCSPVVVRHSPPLFNRVWL